MPLRLRLALWYGALTALVVLAISVATYALHTRAHYDDLDQLLVSGARHVASEGVDNAPGDELASIISAPSASGVVTRVYSGSGELLAEAPSGSSASRVDPAAALSRPSARPFDPIAGLAPPFIHVQAAPGTFQIVNVGSGERWRVYVLPLGASGRYLELAASMQPMDASVARLRWLLIVMGTIGTGAAYLVAWLIAGRALRPVRSMTAAASDIARSRSFSSRVPPTPQQDELGELARTFNEMLGSLESAYQGQQRFVADASHELRAPLTAIQANLELLETHPAMSEPDRRVAVGEASREATRLSRLVADLLALARADAGVPIRRERVELDRVTLEAVQEARHIADGRAVEIEKLDRVVIAGDRDRLKQLLLILLDNAIKYTPESGHVSVSIRANGGGPDLRVTDTGVGIAPDALPHVFDRFYRADPARRRDPGGTGLGLPIARWIADQHGGEVSIESEPGHGTAVTVHFPRLNSPTA